MFERPLALPIPAVEAKRHLIPTAELMARWRNKMSMLSNANYDDAELGSCVVAALQYPDRYGVEIPLCIEHFSRGHEEADQSIVTGAMVELLEGLKILFNRIPLRDESGRLEYMFGGWYFDDMVLDRLPY